MSYDISIVFTLLSVVVCIESIMFHLPPGVKKCFKEEIHKNVFLSGEYELSDAPGHSTLLIVSNILFTLYIYINILYVFCILYTI